MAILQECSSGDVPEQTFLPIAQNFNIGFAIGNVAFQLTYLQFSVFIQAPQSKKFAIIVKNVFICNLNDEQGIVYCDSCNIR